MTEQPNVLDTAVQKFIHHRNEVARINKKAKEEAMVHQQEMEKLRIALLRKLDSIGAKSLRTDSGTIVASETETPACGDWDAFLEWLIANNRADLLQKRLASAQFKDDIAKWAAEAKEKLAPGEELDLSTILPPGITVIREREISIRKSN